MNILDLTSHLYYLHIICNAPGHAFQTVTQVFIFNTLDAFTSIFYN